MPGPQIRTSPHSSCQEEGGGVRGRKHGKQHAQLAAVPRRSSRSKVQRKRSIRVGGVKQQADPQRPGTMHIGATGTGGKGADRRGQATVGTHTSGSCSPPPGCRKNLSASQNLHHKQGALDSRTPYQRSQSFCSSDSTVRAQLFKQESSNPNKTLITRSTSLTGTTREHQSKGRHGGSPI